MTPKKFKKVISDWRMAQYSMRMALPDPMTENEISKFVSALPIKVAKKHLAFTFEFGGKFEIPYNDIQDSVIAGNFSKEFNAGEFYLLTWEEVLSAMETHQKLVELGEFSDCQAEPHKHVQDVWLSDKWLPIASNGSGDFLCIDFAPSDEGTKGQVIGFFHEIPARPKFADSLPDFFSKLATEYEEERIYLTDDDYDLRKMRARDFPTF